MYDLDADPAEQQDLIAAGHPPPNLDALKRILIEWTEWDGDGAALGSTDSLDAASRARLRALGYID